MLVGKWLEGPNEGTVHVSEVTKGQLVVVATPIGNLGDISRRALELLEVADLVFCEDTRRSSTLFSANAIPVNGRLRALHEHNEASLCAQIVDLVATGRVVVVICDAGTPGISDPGSRVVAAVIAAGLPLSTAPGPSAVIAALSVSGLPTERFCMEGFLPRKAGERERRYHEWLHEERTIVFYESPQRLVVTLTEMAAHFGSRRVAVARELTKLHEEVLRGTVASVAELMATRDVLGEIVVVLEGSTDVVVIDDDVLRAAIREQVSHGASTRDAASSVAESFGVARRVAYQMALDLRSGDNV